MKSETPMTMARIIGKFKGRTFVIQSELESYVNAFQHHDHPIVQELIMVMSKVARVCDNTIKETDVDWNNLWEKQPDKVLDINKSI